MTTADHRRRTTFSPHPFTAGLTSILISFATTIMLPSNKHTTTNLFAEASYHEQCSIKQQNTFQKTKYRIGVLANRGIETAYKEFNNTASYLTMAVGNNFDPPIEFENVPLQFKGTILDDFESTQFDFIYTNPAILSCVASEYGMNHLVSVTSRRVVKGVEHHLDVFGGVIFTLANNTSIQSLADIKDKRVGLISLSGFGSGQMQFRELLRAGLFHMQDPKQLIFMETQGPIVKAVLSGQIDVGFVRTDQLERYTDAQTGDPLDMDLIKIIGQRHNISFDGKPFPFPLSTPLYPEWGFASLPHVENGLARQVQIEMLKMADHAAVAENLIACYRDDSCETEQCKQSCFDKIDIHDFETCDTNKDLAVTSYEAMNAGNYAAWRTPLNLLEVRNMQEETGFIGYDVHLQAARCSRTAELDDAIVCPPGYFKRQPDDIQNSCSIEGLDCLGFEECVCRPCIRGFDVEFFPVTTHNDDGDDDDSQQTAIYNNITQGCGKFERCGEVQQMHILTFQAFDRKKRIGEVFSAKILMGSTPEPLPMESLGRLDDIPVHQLKFNATGRRVGLAIIEVFAGDEQIPESPFRFEIRPRDCAIDIGPDSLRVPNEVGECICSNNTVEIASTCIRMSTLLTSILVPLTFLATVFVCWYVERKRRQADMIWKVKPEELSFAEPAQVLGRGTFGLVLLAEYRGTKVAVKRALPPRTVDRTRSPQQRRRRQKQQHPQQQQCDIQSSTTQQELPQDVPRNASVSTFEAEKTDSVSIDIEFGNEQGPQHEDPKHKSSSISLFRFGADSSHDDLMQQFFDSDDVYHDSVFMSERYDVLSGQLSDHRKSGNGSGSRIRFWRSEYSQMRADFMREMRHLSTLRHPCITTVMGAVVCRHAEPMMVLEHMSVGSLYDLLHNESMLLKGDTIMPIVRDISQGLRFLHSANPPVVHGDLKSKNVLIDGQFRAKVADFGLVQKRFTGNAITGTPLWMAPELLRGEGSNTPASDMYAFGITLYEIFSRKRPYEGMRPSEVVTLVADDKANMRPPIPQSCPVEVADIMQACLLSKPEDRMTAQNVDEKLKDWKAVSTKRTEDLLRQLFPENIAKALRDGHKVEPETHDCVTVFFADIVGYTEISSHLSPTKVSNMLDRLYTKFDRLSRVHNVFKVETVGDAYMTVTNLAMEQADHVSIMAHFAIDAVDAAAGTLIDEDEPSKGHVQIRVGFHSGPVASHVVGLRNPRYSIIGDTVNIAARMESSSAAGCIHCTSESARLLQIQAPELDVISRGPIKIKGKGIMKTFWVKSSTPILRATNVFNGGDTSGSLRVSEDAMTASERVLAENDRLVDINMKVLVKYLQRLVAARSVATQSNHVISEGHLDNSKEELPVQEITDTIQLPDYDPRISHALESTESVNLPTQVINQLRSFVTTMSKMYPNNPFHSFEHATCVTQSIDKLLESVVRPRELNDIDGRRKSQTIHDYTYGISSDALAQFAVVFSAIIHDVDHPGVPNSQLVKEGTMMARVYNNTSVAEQNSFELSWHLLMEEQYDELCAAIFHNDESMVRFRKLVVNCVLATDIVDKEIQKFRNTRWHRAFNEESAMEESRRDKANRKATIVIEYLIQASDVAHTMQQWHVYRKWNERLFMEFYQAYVDGRGEVDPSIGWYEGEIGFFDHYIIPLTQKLKDCGVFGSSSSEYLNCAIRNRDEWKVRGQDVVSEMMAKVTKPLT